MAEVNILELEKEAQKKKDERFEVVTKKIGEQTLFKGKVLPTWYDSYDECVNANQEAKRKADNAKLGLNEFGQTKDEEERSKEIKSLIEKRNKALEAVQKIDQEIAAVRNRKEAKKKK